MIVLRIETVSGKIYNISGNVFEYMGEKNYGISGASIIPEHMIKQVLNDINLDLTNLDIPIFNFTHRLMLLDSRNNDFDGAEYNGMAFPTHIIIGARNEKVIQLNGVDGIGGLIIHEIGHAIMYKAIGCTYQNHMTNPKFVEYMKLRGIPSTFTDKSLWEKRPAEIFAEDFRYLFGDEYMKEEAFLPYNNISKPSLEIRKFMVDLMAKYGVKELADVVKPSEPTVGIPVVKPTPEVPLSVVKVNPNFMLILDDGHGLDTAGKRTPMFENGEVILENTFNSAVVNYIAKLCIKKGIKYSLTAPELNDVSLPDRVAREKKFRKDFLLANPKGKTAMVSIHYNAHKEDWGLSTANGVETWYSEGSVEGKKIADLIHTELIKGTKQTNRGVKSASNFYILKNTMSPAILVEGGFMDDSTEARLMTGVNFQKEVALEVFNGMMKYWVLPTAGYSDFDIVVVKPTPTKPATPPVVPKPVVDSNLKLVKSRFKSSDVYHVEIPMSEYWIYPTLGTKGKLEKLSGIVNDFEKRVGVDIRVAWNVGFFNLNGSSEHLGNFIVNFGKEPAYQYAQSPNFIDFISYKNGNFECRQNSMKKEDAILLQPKINFIVGCSYSLVIDGKINIINADKFSHSKQDNPRTMVGWNKAKNTFIVAIIDGRKVGSVGLIATEQAEYMLKLGCTVAVNYDGGGSSELIFDNGADRDLIANTPSDGVERKIGSAMVIYKK